MSRYSSIKPPESLEEVLRPLGSLSASEFDIVANAIKGPRSFSLSKEGLDQLRKQIPNHATVLSFLLAALSYLYSHVSQLADAGISFADAINSLADEIYDEKSCEGTKDQLKERLARLLAKQENHQRFRKYQRLHSGFIPNALGFSTLVDLRPDFGDTDDLALKGYIPVIQFRITTDAPNAEARRLVFQISEDALGELKKAMDRAQAKLSLLKKDPVLAAQIIKMQDV